MTASSTPSCCSRYVQQDSCIMCGCSLPNSRDITQMTQKLLLDHRQNRGISPKDARKQPVMTASSTPSCCSRYAQHNSCIICGCCLPNSRDITRMTQKLLLDHRQKRGISPKDARKQPAMTASSTPSYCSQYVQQDSCIMCWCSLPNSRDITRGL